MLKQLFLVLFILIISFLKAKAQEIRVYHATPGQSVIFHERDDERNARWTEKEFIRAKGSKIEIVVLNPNPFFYNYELKLEEFEIKEEFPDITDLLGAINALSEPAQKAASAAKTLTALSLTAPGPFEEFQNHQAELMSEINRAKRLILASDAPESRRVALMDDTPDGGFRKAVAGIEEIDRLKGHFNSPTLAKDLEALLEEGLKDPLIVQGLSDEANKKRTISIYRDAFTLLNNQLVATIDAIKKACRAEPVIRFVLPVTDKNQKVFLEITKKKGHEDKTRTAEKKLICTIIPEFDRRTVELVPVVNLTYASAPPKFGVSNGLITRATDDGFRFSAGAMLLVNWMHFGKYKEMSWGAGLGYAIPKKNVLESFSLATMVSYKNSFRIGLGAGFSSYPGGLKDNLQVGAALPANIKNIDEVVEYKRTLSFFITFSISGLTLLKKQ